MKIIDASPSDAAASPQHPRHAQWVKQTLIEDEAKTISDAGRIPDISRIEREWIQALNVSERRAEMRKHKPKPKGKLEDPAAFEASSLGYHFRRGNAWAREKNKALRIANATLAAEPETRNLFLRVQTILQRYRMGDPDFFKLGQMLGVIFTSSRRRKGRFKGLSAEQREIELKRALVKVCDHSADRTALGAWH